MKLRAYIVFEGICSLSRLCFVHFYDNHSSVAVCKAMGKDKLDLEEDLILKREICDDERNKLRIIRIVVRNCKTYILS